MRVCTTFSIEGLEQRYGAAFTACIIAKYPTQVADWLINPMCRGIFAGDSKLLSLKSCFPLLYGYEQNHGSIIKGMLRGSDGKKRLYSASELFLL